MEASSVRNLNIFLLGLAFFLIFTAFLTLSHIQTVIIENAKDPDSSGYVEGFAGDGYLSLVVIYGCGIVSNFLAPSLQAVLGLRASMMIASVMYATYYTTYLKLSTASLYIGAALLGLGSGPLWVSQGAFLSRNSDESTSARNSGIFYVMFQGSGVVGNTFSYFYFRDGHEIDDQTRNIFTGALLCVNLAGTLVFLAMRSPPEKGERRAGDHAQDSPWVAVKRAAKLLTTREMSILSIFFAYLGLAFAFTTGVYGPSLSFTRAFEDSSNGLAGLSGILVHTGNVLAGLCFAVYGRAVAVKFGRSPVIIAAMVCNFMAYIFIALNLPSDAPFGPTEAEAVVIPSSLGMALAGSFLLGVGDGTLNTQTMAMLATVYADGSARQAFAAFKAIQFGFAGACFAYAGYLSLHWQIGILLTMGSAGVTAFVVVDRGQRETQQNQIA